MRLRIFGEVLLLAIAVVCTGGWCWQYQHDRQKLDGVDAKLLENAMQISELEEQYRASKMQAGLAKLKAESQIHQLHQTIRQMGAALGTKTVGPVVMHYYPKDRSIE